MYCGNNCSAAPKPDQFPRAFVHVHSIQLLSSVYFFHCFLLYSVHLAQIQRDKWFVNGTEPLPFFIPRYLSKPTLPLTEF